MNFKMYIAQEFSLAAVILIGAAAIVTGLLLIAGHWFPWEKMMRKPLGRIPSYIYGVLSILAPASAAMALLDQINAVITIWVCAIVGGIAVVIAYGLDHYLTLRIRKDQLESNNDSLSEFIEER